MGMASRSCLERALFVDIPGKFSPICQVFFLRREAVLVLPMRQCLCTLLRVPSVAHAHVRGSHDRYPVAHNLLEEGHVFSAPAHDVGVKASNLLVVGLVDAQHAEGVVGPVTMLPDQPELARFASVPVHVVHVVQLEKLRVVHTLPLDSVAPTTVQEGASNGHIDVTHEGQVVTLQAREA